MLKPQDIVLALKLIALDGAEWTYPAIAASLSTSASATHQSFQRLVVSGLAESRGRRVQRAALIEFLVHGLRYVFPVVRGPQTRGVPTGPSAPVFSGRLARSDSSLVWPSAKGTARGDALEPLHAIALKAAAKDERLYTLLSVTDALRVGTAREREVAASVLRELFAQKPTTASKS